MAAGPTPSAVHATTRAPERSRRAPAALHRDSLGSACSLARPIGRSRRPAFGDNMMGGPSGLGCSSARPVRRVDISFSVFRQVVPVLRI
jgi:hypothetical protein